MFAVIDATVVDIQIIISDQSIFCTQIFENEMYSRIYSHVFFFFKVTKCIFHKYGPSGSIQKHDALCVMALNIVNEKIYTVLWFWFVVLAVITGLGLVWRMLTMILHARLLNFVLAYFSVVSVPYKFTPRYSFTNFASGNSQLTALLSRIKKFPENMDYTRQKLIDFCYFEFTVRVKNSVQIKFYLGRS